MLLTRSDSSGNWHENAGLGIVLVRRKCDDVEGFYELLGVDVNATDDEVRAAGKRLIIETHPDTGGDSESFIRAVRAYQTLSDPQERARYDTCTRAPKASVKTGHNASFTFDFAHGDVPAWYKEPAMVLTDAEVARVRRWHFMLLQAARRFQLPLEIKAGVCRYPTGYYIKDDIAVIGREQEPDGRVARLYMYMRLCERKR